MSALAVGVFGLGEAGTLIAADLAAAGVRVKGYDPVVETAPPDVELRPDPVSAVRDANVVLAITAERDAPRALSQALEAIPSESLTDELEAADEALVARLLRGTARHAERRLHEMEASVALLEELGVDPVMTRSTVERLRRVFEEGVPEPPLRQGTGG